jgi:hypothetical protein
MKKSFLVRFYQVIFFSIHLLLALALLALPACRHDDAGSTRKTIADVVVKGNAK